MSKTLAAPKPYPSPPLPLATRGSPRPLEASPQFLETPKRSRSNVNNILEGRHKRPPFLRECAAYRVHEYEVIDGLFRQVLGGVDSISHASAAWTDVEPASTSSGGNGGGTADECDSADSGTSAGGGRGASALRSALKMASF